MFTSESHPAFQLEQRLHVDTLNVTMHEFTHRVTGAKHWHLGTDHPENVFLVAFRTVPTDSTGVAHILEHTALCGSERFPVRDPFFLMIRRSLNTFMNAFTASDYTAYPFATQSHEDYFNLLSIYLDAAFFPLLDPLDFAQEGHRLEFEQPDDPATPLVHRGVVYNEMRGAMSSPVSRLHQAVHTHLFPGTTYHFNSGGEPESIVALDHADLTAFWRRHYQPSNAMFMTFGDLPADVLQARFEAEALSRFEERAEPVIVVPAARLDKPLQVREAYSVDETRDLSDRSHIVMAWLLDDGADLLTSMRCHLVSDVLLDTSASPLRHALETTGFAASASPLCGLEDSTRELAFMCGVEGTAADNTAAVESLVLETLAHVAEEGVPQSALDAVLHQLELSEREIGGDGSPYGLQLMFAVLPAAVHGGDTVAAMDLESVLVTLREEIREPQFLADFIRSKLLDNPHRVTVTLYPELDLAAQRDEAVQAALEARRAALTPAERAAIVAAAADLKVRQDTDDDLSLLPSVGLEDVPADRPVPAGEGLSIHGLPLTRYAAGTNGLVYQQVVSRLPLLADEALMLLPVFSTLLAEVGSGGRDYLTTQAMQHGVCGGINAFAAVRATLDGSGQPGAWYTVSSKALRDKADAMFPLVRDTLLAPRFDEHERLLELVSHLRLRRESGLTGNGHGHVMTAAAAALSPVAALNHRLTGLASLPFLRTLNDALRGGDFATFERGLAALQGQIAGAEKQLLLVGQGEALDALTATLAETWQQAACPASGEPLPFAVGELADTHDTLFVTATDVNFCATAWPTVPEAHDDAPALMIAAGVLRNGYLHQALRERGGAYGGGASHDAANGIFRCYSYRDPRLDETFADIERALDWLLGGGVTDAGVEEAILGIIGSLDAPGSPAGEARQAFHAALFGRDATARKRQRERLLAVRVADVRRVVATWLADVAPVRVALASRTAATESRLGFRTEEV